jgi:hypothetical protein
MVVVSWFGEVVMMNLRSCLDVCKGYDDH